MDKKRRYTKAFKLDAVQLVTEQGYSCAQAARSLDIKGNILGRWVREYRAKEAKAFGGSGQLTDEQLELRRLREENRRLRLEKEILKKAAAFFAQETY